ncbi:MAG: 16S rRNA (cytosine(1402)-N(4))-methyltransferase RsmH, partial [Proteobacteria bacterium]|nr:16S rRNA (cytosine(1402)-N(4))-methyltransferase RsmH [Pseudomonadota bacterium]
MASVFAHEPVLLDETIRHLHLHPGSVVIDGTIGGGGHARHILGKLGSDGTLIGMDVDGDALRATKRRLEDAGVLDGRVHLVHTSFRRVGDALASLGIQKVDAVLLDLGVSSHQLDTRERGFRFAEAETHPAPLDMRMDPSSGQSAAELLRRASEAEIEGWLREYGELPGARRLARAIADSRDEHPLETNADLLRVIRETRVGRGRQHNPATLVFQALRIMVNDELSSLEEGLEAAVGALRESGRVVVLAYHSAEDRIVKRRFRDEARACICPPEVPICVCGHSVRLDVL